MNCQPPQLIEARRRLHLGPDFPDSRIRATLDLVDFDNLVPVPAAIPVSGS